MYMEYTRYIPLLGIYMVYTWSRYIPTIWNPDHLDKNWQNGTYVSEHGTDMYIDVHAFTYRHEHVCTWYVHVHKYM
jgi:hypothetical protein